MNLKNFDEDITDVLQNIERLQKRNAKGFCIKSVNWNGLKLRVDSKNKTIYITKFPDSFYTASKTQISKISEIIDKFIAHITTCNLDDGLEDVKILIDKDSEEIQKLYVYEVLATIKALVLEIKKEKQGFYSDEDLTGLKLSFLRNTITIKAYPDCFEKYRNVSTTYQKLQVSFTNLIQSCMKKERHSAIKVRYTELPLAIKEKDGVDRDTAIKNAEFEYRLKHINSNIAFAFKFESNVAKRSIGFSYVPDRIFLNKLKEILHPSYAALFDEVHEFDSKEVYVDAHNGKIHVYDNPKMNEALAYIVNHYCKKKYHVDSFELPHVLIKLMLLGSPTVDIEEISEQLETGSDQERIEQNSIFEEEIFIEHFDHFKITEKVRELSDYVVNNFRFLEYYNYKRNGKKDIIEGDKNRVLINSVISDFSETKGKRTKHLLRFYSTLALQELQKTYLVMFYEFYHQYHIKKIPDDLFTVKKEKDSKGKSLKNKN